MLIELKFFKDIDTLVWIVTAQIWQLVDDNPTRAIDLQEFNFQIILFPNIYFYNRLTNFGADFPRRLFCRCFRSSLIGSFFQRLFCWLPLALLVFFDCLLSARLFGNCLLSSFLGSRLLRLFCLLSSCLGSGLLRLFCLLGCRRFLAFTGIGPTPQFDDFLSEDLTIKMILAF